MAFTIITYTMGQELKRHVAASEIEADETVAEIEKSGGTVIDIDDQEYDPYAFDPATATDAQWDEYLLFQPQESPEQEAHFEAELKRGDLAFLPHQLYCSEHQQEFPVTKRGKVVGKADPTQTYVLACGHTTF